MTELSRAVFLSYASEDAAAAQRVADALRDAGIEVWFDQSELRGGDAWDHKIRDQIHECRLFIPVISANTERRDEGYFRREWALAADRTRDMAHNRTFLVPVVIDGTAERGASVPDKFHEVQWTRVPGGETPPAFVEQIRRLLTPDASPAMPSVAAGSARGPVAAPSIRRSPLPKAATWIAAAIVALVCAYFVADKLWLSRYSITHTPAAVPGAQQTAPSGGTAAPFNPPPHSVAVLPFVNMSGDKTQDYFSDGLSEELLNSLARINELQVAARTSSFYFKGERVDLPTIAHKLNVASVLEGSVRRSGHTIRVTAQLNNAVTGYHLWSATYDRDLKDVLKVQTEIATAVANALKLTLLGDLAARIEVGGTRNPVAFDAYLRGSRIYAGAGDANSLQAAIKEYSMSIQLDPQYAMAFARRSMALSWYAGDFATGPAIREYFVKSEADARRAIALAPDLPEGHVALADCLVSGSQQFAQANVEYEHALELAPGNGQVLASYGPFAVWMGRADVGITAARRAVQLDPLDPLSHSRLGHALFFAKRYGEAVAAFEESLALEPNDDEPYAFRGFAHYAMGNIENSRASCEAKPNYWASQLCLAISYHRLGRHREAEAILAKLRAAMGDAEAYGYAEVYTQWGDSQTALKWLETALRLRDPGLVYVKTDPLLDPLRTNPRFQAIERALKFPD